MEKTENKFITVAYKLYTIEDGEKDFAEEATADKPFQFISGMGLTLPKFESNICSLQKGEKFDFTLSTAEGYGEYDEAQIVNLPKKAFEIDGKFDSEHITEGAIIPLMSPDGQHFNGSVEKVTETEVTVDLNHPLAGCELQFVGEVVDTRLATNEELAAVAKMLSGEGGCGCGNCGGNCESGCGKENCGGCN